MLDRIWRGLTGHRTPPKPSAPARPRRDEDADDDDVGPDNAQANFARKEFTLALPAGYPAAQVTVQIDVPPLPKDRAYRFCDHMLDGEGRPTKSLLATTTGGFAISHDLGGTWKAVTVKAHRDHRFIHVRSIGNGEYLAQVQPFERDPTKTDPLDLIVVGEDGAVRASHPGQGTRWHGCRAVDQAGDTIMYAEYPSGGNPRPARVLRSRDRGRSWQVVFERNAQQIRHFHFLQAHPANAREWWLTSGDRPNESRIWVSKDDGETWNDLTDTPDRLDVGGAVYPRSIFRLTDLVWDGNEVLWGTDDVLPSIQGDTAGARLFRSEINTPLKPVLAGRSRWHIRSIVDAGDFYVLLTQGSNLPDATADERRPSALLMPKHPVDGAPDNVHLLDVDVFSEKPRAGRGFSYSKASRAAIDGTFFSFRAPFHVFPAGHQILRWNLKFS